MPDMYEYNNKMESIKDKTITFRKSVSYVKEFTYHDFLEATCKHQFSRETKLKIWSAMVDKDEAEFFHDDEGDQNGADGEFDEWFEDEIDDLKELEEKPELKTNFELDREMKLSKDVKIQVFKYDDQYQIITGKTMDKDRNWKSYFFNKGDKILSKSKLQSYKEGTMTNKFLVFHFNDEEQKIKTLKELHKEGIFKDKIYENANESTEVIIEK